MIMLALLGLLVAVCLFLHVKASKNRKKFYELCDENKKDAAVFAKLVTGWSVARGIFTFITAVFTVVIALVNIGAQSESIQDRQMVRQYDAMIAIQQEKAEALCTEFSVLLGKTYPEHEKNIFGMITPENIDVYYARYPKVKANGTAVELTEKIKKIKGAYYDLRSEREVVLKDLRYRSQNPWFVSAVIGQPFEDRDQYGWWFVCVLICILIMVLAYHEAGASEKFFGKVYGLRLQYEVFGAKPPDTAGSATGAWAVMFIAFLIFAGVLSIIGVINTATSWSEQISDKQEVVQIDRQAQIAKEKAMVLSDEFKRILVTDYQIHETELFGMMSPKEMRAYLVSYPELRLADTVIALVGQMNELWGEYYDKLVEREMVLMRLRYRPRSPWLIQAFVPSAERMLEEAAIEVSEPATIRSAE